MSVFEAGTEFLVQLQNDLGSLLDSLVSDLGDDPAIADLMIQLIVDRFLPALGEIGDRVTSVAVVFIDPASFALRSPSGNRTINDKQRNVSRNENAKTFFSAERNVDLIVVADAVGNYDIEIAGVPATGRMAIVLFDNVQTGLINLTNSLRSGLTNFSFTIGTSAPVISTTDAVTSPFDNGLATSNGDTASRQNLPSRRPTVSNRLLSVAFNDTALRIALRDTLLETMDLNQITYFLQRQRLADQLLQISQNGLIDRFAASRADLTAIDQYFQNNRLRSMTQSVANLSRTVLNQLRQDLNLRVIDLSLINDVTRIIEPEDAPNVALFDAFWGSPIGRNLGKELSALYRLSKSVDDALALFDLFRAIDDFPESNAEPPTGRSETGDNRESNRSNRAVNESETQNSTNESSTSIDAGGDRAQSTRQNANFQPQIKIPENAVTKIAADNVETD